MSTALESSSLREEYSAINWRYREAPDPVWAEFAQLIADHYIPPQTGRPSLLKDKETISRLLHHLAKGNYRDTACHLAGTTDVTLAALMRRGEAGEQPFDAFLWAVKRAEGEAEADSVQLVRSAGKDPRFWAAAATWLERKFPSKYGRRQDESDAPRVQVIIGVQQGDVKLQAEVNIISASPQVPDVLQLSQATEPPLSEANGSRTHPDPQAILDVSPQRETHLAPLTPPVSALVLERKPLTNAAPGESAIGGARSAGGPTGQRRPAPAAQRALVQRRRLARLKKKAKDAKGLA